MCATISKGRSNWCMLSIFSWKGQTLGLWLGSRLWLQSSGWVHIGRWMAGCHVGTGPTSLLAKETVITHRYCSFLFWCISVRDCRWREFWVMCRQQRCLTCWMILPTGRLGMSPCTKASTSVRSIQTVTLVTTRVRVMHTCTEFMLQLQLCYSSFKRKLKNHFFSMCFDDVWFWLL